MNKLKSSVRIDELDGLSDTILRFYKTDENAKDDTFLAIQMGKLEDLSVRITKAVLRGKIISTLSEKDEARISTVAAIGKVLNGYKSMLDDETKRAASYLDAIYSRYKESGLVRKNYKAKSSLIESLIGDFSEEEALSCIGKLKGVASLVSSLREAQDAFTAASDRYVRAVNLKGESASSLKEPMLSLINGTLVPYLTTMAGAGNTALSGLSKDIESEIKRVNTMISTRAKAGKSTAESSM